MFGSRAKGLGGLESDWDYMVFANESTLEKLRDDQQFHCAGIDRMIVTDGDEFATPWVRYSGSKSGRLAKVDGGWNWDRLSRAKAIYCTTKPPEAEGREVRDTQAVCSTHVSERR